MLMYDVFVLISKWGVGSTVITLHCTLTTCMYIHGYPLTQFTDGSPLPLSPSIFQVAVRDKSLLQAEVASLQKSNMNLARGKNILEAKVCIHTHTHTLLS